MTERLYSSDDGVARAPSPAAFDVDLAASTFTVGFARGESARATQDMQILETERRLLREFVPDDIDALAAVISDPEIMLFYPEPRDRAGVESWIEGNQRRYRDDGHGLWAMVLKSSGEVVGDCGLIRQTVEGVDEIEIGYHLRRDLWGRGLAPEAAGACRDYGFEQLGAKQLISLIRPQNLPSRRVAEKVGLESVEGSVVEGFADCVYLIRGT